MPTEPPSRKAIIVTVATIVTMILLIMLFIYLFTGLNKTLDKCSADLVAAKAESSALAKQLADERAKISKGLGNPDTLSRISNLETELNTARVQLAALQVELEKLTTNSTLKSTFKVERLESLPPDIKITPEITVTNSTTGKTNSGESPSTRSLSDQISSIRSAIARIRSDMQRIRNESAESKNRLNTCEQTAHDIKITSEAAQKAILEDNEWRAKIEKLYLTAVGEGWLNPDNEYATNDEIFANAKKLTLNMTPDNQFSTMLDVYNRYNVLYSDTTSFSTVNKNELYIRISNIFMFLKYFHINNYAANQSIQNWLKSDIAAKTRTLLGETNELKAFLKKNYQYDDNISFKHNVLITVFNLANANKALQDQIVVLQQQLAAQNVQNGVVAVTEPVANGAAALMAAKQNCEETSQKYYVILKAIEEMLGPIYPGQYSDSFADAGVKQLITDYNAVKASLDAVTAERNAINETLASERSRFSATEAAYKASVDELGGKLTDSQNRFLTMEKSYQTQLAAVTAELNALIAATGNNESAPVNSSSIASADTISTLQSQIATLQGQLDVMTANRDALNAQLTKADADKAALQAQVTEFNSSIQLLKSKIDELNAQIFTLEASQTSLQNNLSTTVAANQQLTDKINALTSENTTLREYVQLVNKRAGQMLIASGAAWKSSADTYDTVKFNENIDDIFNFIQTALRGCPPGFTMSTKGKCVYSDEVCPIGQCATVTLDGVQQCARRTMTVNGVSAPTFMCRIPVSRVSNTSGNDYTNAKLYQNIAGTETYSLGYFGNVYYGNSRIVTPISQLGIDSNADLRGKYGPAYSWRTTTTDPGDALYWYPDNMASRFPHVVPRKSTQVLPVSATDFGETIPRHVPKTHIDTLALNDKYA